MALSQTTVISRVRTLVAELTGMERVYAASEDDDNAIPSAFREFPCAAVFPGPTSGEYLLAQGQQRHTYLVKVQVFQAGADIGERAAAVLPFVDLLIGKFELNVALGGRANSCTFTRCSGFVTLEYAGADYLGYEIDLEVSEQASAAPAYGS